MEKVIKKIFVLVSIGFFLVTLGFLFGHFFLGFLGQNSKPMPKNNPTVDENIAQQITSGKSEFVEKTKQPNTQLSKNIEKLRVPFIVQAPFGNWSDPVFQNACEESSIVMAMGWINNAQSIGARDAQSKILDIVKFENETFGYNEDTDVFEVARIFREHFGKSDVTVKENISLGDIISELEKGNLVLVPAFGQSLANPNYTPPGPIAHMVVVTGYNEGSKKFITNDPGTKNGADYKYDENVLFEAIWQYPSGKGPLEIPAKEAMKKAMVIVPKN